MAAEAAQGARTLTALGAQAPERLLDRVDSTAGDVYSYGILLFEIITRQPPWTGMSNVKAARAVCHGRTLRLPPQAPLLAHRLVEQCFCFDGNARPKMEDVLHAVHSDWHAVEMSVLSSSRVVLDQPDPAQSNALVRTQLAGDARSATSDNRSPLVKMRSAVDLRTFAMQRAQKRQTGDSGTAAGEQGELTTADGQPAATASSVSRHGRAAQDSNELGSMASIKPALVVSPVLSARTTRRSGSYRRSQRHSALRHSVDAADEQSLSMGDDLPPLPAVPHEQADDGSALPAAGSGLPEPHADDEQADSALLERIKSPHSAQALSSPYDDVVIGESPRAPFLRIDLTALRTEDSEMRKTQAARQSLRAAAMAPASSSQPNNDESLSSDSDEKWYEERASALAESLLAGCSAPVTLPRRSTSGGVADRALVAARESVAASSDDGSAPDAGDASSFVLRVYIAKAVSLAVCRKFADVRIEPGTTADDMRDALAAAAESELELHLRRRPTRNLDDYVIVIRNLRTGAYLGRMSEMASPHRVDTFLRAEGIEPMYIFRLATPQDDRSSTSVSQRSMESESRG